MPKVRRGDVVWVEPKLVAEIEFAEWTRDGRLRAPVYVGLRDDKPADDVVAERMPMPEEIRRGRRVLKLSNLDKLVLARRGDHEGRPARLLPRRRSRPRPAPARAGRSR